MLKKNKNILALLITRSRAVSGRVTGLLAPAVRGITLKRLAMGGGGAVLVMTTAYTISFFRPRAISFSFDGKACITNPTLLPRLVEQKPGERHKAAAADMLTVAGYPVYAHRTCVSATRAPEEHRSETASLAYRAYLPFKKSLRITTGAAPSLADTARLDRPVATQDPLIVKLDQPDAVFTYRLAAGTKTVDCITDKARLSCDTSQLQLAQSAHYRFTLEKLFKGAAVGQLFSRDMATVEAVHITASSIASGQLVYDIPTAITLQLNKSAETLTNAKLYNVVGGERQELPVEATMEQDKIILRLLQPLPRNASLAVTIEDITAPDGGFLNAPYELSFSTSGGPKVVHASIGKNRVQPGSSVVLTFDTDIAAAQNIADFVRLESGGKAVAASVTMSGRKVTIRPAALPRCAPFSVKVLDGLQNTFGVAGGSAWQYNSRILCQTVFSIGTSVQGRSITAYRFGTGPSTIIFLGGTHGNEKSSVYIMNRWVDYLENNPDRIPAHRTIIVIPNLNPDGYAIGQRTNANNVDLNRNFPTSNWKQGVTMPDKSFNANGGGSAPLSEPESRALANYVLGQSPRLVLTYHASGGVVVPNDAGDSNALAITYGQKSSVGYMASGGTATFFEYDTTGAFEDWIGQKHGRAALLIELLTKTNNEFSGHQNALWYIVQLP